MRSTIISLKNHENLVVVGDLNIDYTSKKAAKELISIEREFHIKQLITSPTRITQKTETLLDHIYTNSDKIIKSGVLPLNLSDHYPVFLILKKLPVKYERVTFTCRQTKYLDIEQLKKMLQDADWTSFYRENDINKAWAEMYRIYTLILDKLCPMVQYINVKKKQEWITPNLFEMMKRRDYLYRLAKKRVKMIGLKREHHTTKLMRHVVGRN